MSDIVERLRQAQEWMRQPDRDEEVSLADLVRWVNERPAGAFPEAECTITRLRADNERLREALEEIADQESNHAADIRCNCTPQDMLIEARAIARAAITKGESRE